MAAAAHLMDVHYHVRAIQDRDPLGADELLALLPAMNERADVGALIGLLPEGTARGYVAAIGAGAVMAVLAALTALRTRRA